ncbi:unnamed protein product [Lepidochelys kempii]
MAPQEDKTITSHNPAGERVSPEPSNASSQSAKGQSPETDLGCSFPPQRMSACVLPGFCMLSVQNAKTRAQQVAALQTDDSFSVGPGGLTKSRMPELSGLEMCGPHLGTPSGASSRCPHLSCPRSLKTHPWAGSISPGTLAVLLTKSL